jgi:hypothetical protein
MVNQKSYPTVFFYCSPSTSVEKAAVQWSIVCLAEGFKTIGVPFYSNINFWKTSVEPEEYLFNHNPDVTPDDCAIVVMDGDWCNFGNPLPQDLFKPNRRYTTAYFELFSDAKNAWKPEFKQFDFIFRAHYNTRFKYPANFHPWAFGLPNRVLKATYPVSNAEDRARKLLVNFRIGHPLRNYISENFLPLIQEVLPVDNSSDSFDAPPAGSYDYLQWEQTGKRHYPSYYKRLSHSIACACFGGLFINPWPLDAFGPKSFLDRAINKTLTTFDPRPRRIMNWESMRFWESLAAGCVPLHVDLEKYGALLPEMPKNWRHYIGVDLDNLQEAVDRITSEPEILDKISVEGREWALQHYSPEPVALRFLETVLK